MNIEYISNEKKNSSNEHKQKNGSNEQKNCSNDQNNSSNEQKIVQMNKFKNQNISKDTKIV